MRVCDFGLSKERHASLMSSRSQATRGAEVVFTAHCSDAQEVSGGQVCDFGLSRVRHASLMSSRSQVGTPGWTAPEVLRSQGYNEKSDVWSMGVRVLAAPMQLCWSCLLVVCECMSTCSEHTAAKQIKQAPARSMLQMVAGLQLEVC